MAGTPAGTVVVRAAGLRVHGGTVVTARGCGAAGGRAGGVLPPGGDGPGAGAPGRDGAAGAWLPDLVRLGELERHLGDGVIEAIVDAELGKGRLRPRERRRLMSYPLVIRLMIAMTLMPEASYCEALARLAGLLADVPFALEWHVPTGKVITGWRLLIPADVMEGIFWQAAGPLISDDEPSAVLLAGMMVLAADGMLVNLADTPANRAMFGSTGTADDSAPFPQLRVVALTARAGRALLGAILGGSSAGEQTLLRRLVKRRPDLFAGRVICFDRNFPGYDLIMAILDAGGHVIARMKEGISLGFEDGPDRGWLPDGSRLSWLNAPSGKKARPAPVRVTEHNAIMPSGDGTEEVSETCTVITTLLDHHAAPADAVRETYLTRWSASETTFGEDKTTIAGAGNRTSGPVLRSGQPAAGHPGGLGLADRHPAGPRLRRGSAPQRARRRPRPAPERRRPGDRGRGILHRRPPPHDPVHDIHPGHSVIVAGRDRRCSRRRRPRRPAHPQRPRTAAALQTRAESPPEIPARHRDQDDRHRETPGHRIRTRLLPEPAARTGTVRKEEPARARRDRGPWNRALPRRDTRAETTPARHPETDLRARAEHQKPQYPIKPQKPKA